MKELVESSKGRALRWIDVEGGAKKLRGRGVLGTEGHCRRLCHKTTQGFGKKGHNGVQRLQKDQNGGDRVHGRFRQLLRLFVHTPKIAGYVGKKKKQYMGWKIAWKAAGERRAFRKRSVEQTRVKLGGEGAGKRMELDDDRLGGFPSLSQQKGKIGGGKTKKALKYL